MTPEPIVKVESLRVEFTPPTARSLGVKDVSFEVQPGETVCVVGESGSGKSVTSLSLMRLVEFGGGRIAGGTLLLHAAPTARSIDLAKADAAEMRAHPRQRDRHDLPGADDLAQPGLHDRAATDRRAARASRASGVPRAEARALELAAAGPHPRARASAQAVSARTFRRHAPARGHRHGDGLQSAAADRRRADHGARRDHPGRDPGPDRPAEARERHGGAVHHPRHGGGRADGRPRRGHVPRRDGRGRPGAATSSSARAQSLHQGAAGRRAEARRDAGQGRARADAHPRRRRAIRDQRRTPGRQTRTSRSSRSRT